MDSKIRQFRPRGAGTFVDATGRWGGADPGPSTASAFLDADGDGDLDLYVANYVDYDPEHPPNEGRPCEWKGLAVSCGPRGTTAVADTFWENLQKGVGGIVDLRTLDAGAEHDYLGGSVADRLEIAPDKTYTLLSGTILDIPYDAALLGTVYGPEEFAGLTRGQRLLALAIAGSR